MGISSKTEFTKKSESGNSVGKHRLKLVCLLVCLLVGWLVAWLLGWLVDWLVS